MAALAISLTTTVVLFGLAPAEIINRQVQSWFFTVVLLLMPALFVSWIAWRSLRRRRFQFSIRDMLVLSFVAGLVVFLAASLVRLNEGAFGKFPFPLSVPARGWKAWMQPSTPKLYLRVPAGGLGRHSNGLRIMAPT